MSNHIHLLLREREDTVSEVVKKLGITYAYYFNKKYGRSGHLFQDRFRSEPVDIRGGRFSDHFRKTVAATMFVR